MDLILCIKYSNLIFQTILYKQNIKFYLYFNITNPKYKVIIPCVTVRGGSFYNFAMFISRQKRVVLQLDGGEMRDNCVLVNLSYSGVRNFLFFSSRALTHYLRKTPPFSSTY